MRTNEERIEAMHRRAAELEREQRVRKARFAGTAAALVSFAAVILLAIMMPDLFQVVVPENSGMSGSIFASGGHLGGIVICIIAFLLGAAASAFCFRLRDYARGNAEMAEKHEER